MAAADDRTVRGLRYRGSIKRCGRYIFTYIFFKSTAVNAIVVFVLVTRCRVNHSIAMIGCRPWPMASGGILLFRPFGDAPLEIVQEQEGFRTNRS